MATLLNSANFSGRNGPHFHLDLYYDLIATSIENNNHTIRYYEYWRADPTYYGSGSTVYGYINGSLVGTANSISAGENKLLGTLDVVVPCDDLGNATASYSASIDTSWTLGDASLSGSFGLPTIPRASQPTATSGNIEEAIVIYTNRKSSVFTHTLKYAFGSLSGTIATGVTDSYAWNLPSTFYAQIPNSSYGMGTITCETYNGSQLIGSKTCQFTAYASESKCKPIISVMAKDINSITKNLTGNDQDIIKFSSNVQVDVSTTSKNSATIASVSISSGDGRSINGTSGIFIGAESNYFQATVKDSRGFTSSDEVTLDLIEYIKLTCNTEVYRETQTSNTVHANISGNYFNDTFGTVNNTLTLEFRFKEKNTSEWSDWSSLTPTIQNNTYIFDGILRNDLDYQKYYDFEFRATDKINPVTTQDSITAGIPIMGLFEKFIELWGIKTFEIIEEEEEV